MSETENGITIPKWFLSIMGVVLTLVTVGGIPWAVWVTKTLIAIESTKAHIDASSTRISSLEKSREEHATQLQVVAATRFTSEQARLMLTGTDAKLDRLESKLDASNRDLTDLRREFDRTFGKTKALP